MNYMLFICLWATMVNAQYTVNPSTGSGCTVDLAAIYEATNQTRACATPNAESFNLLLPKTEGQQFQVLGVIDNNGTLSWITTVTNSATISSVYALVHTATSADIPLTLVLRDSAGSFSANILTVTGVIANSATITTTGVQACLIFTDSGSTIIGEICVNQHALILAPVVPRAIQATLDGNTRGVSAVDFQLRKILALQVASGNYAVIFGGQNNTASGNNTFAAGNSAQALSDGTFVWGDNTAQSVPDSGTQTFNVRSNGGVVFAVQAPSHATDISLTIAADNSAQPAVSLAATGTESVISLEMRVRSSGALFASSDADPAVTGPFGANAVNLQMDLAGNTSAFAAGDFSVITGGSGNSTTEIYSSVNGGFENAVEISSPYSAVFSGFQNTTTAQIAGFSCVVSGNTNMIDNDYNVIMGGLENTCLFQGENDLNLFMGAGNFNDIAAGSNNAIIGGQFNDLLSSSNGASIIGAGQNWDVLFNLTAGGFIGAGESTGSTIATGNQAGIMAGSRALAESTSSAVFAGINNEILSASVATSIESGIHAGQSNTIGANPGTFSTSGSFIGAGMNNTIVNTVALSVSAYSAILSGSSNNISSSPAFASVAIVSGQKNVILEAVNSIIGAGFNGDCAAGYSCIVSGSSNSMTAVGAFGSGILCGMRTGLTGNTSSILGGGSATQNQSIASGVTNSAILSGAGCAVNANFGLAAGNQAQVNNTGSFVWADSTSAVFTDSTVNSFNARASGGFYLSTNSTGSINLFVAPGGNSWISLSDKSYKSHALSVNATSVLSTLNTIPINTWNLVGQSDSITHIGAYAGDFNNAFGYGEDPTYINTMDAIGVLMASVQGLYQLYEAGAKELPFEDYYVEQHEIRDSQVYIEKLKSRIKRLEEILTRGG